MDNKDGNKKKESIDEILSDLNGLLNKMPSILDGIKMPEIKPAEFAPAREEKRPEPEPPAVPPAAADKTVVLEGFHGLPEGAKAPEEPRREPPADAADKTVVIESLSSLPEGAKAPAQDKLVTQSLGDFMFGEDAEHAQPQPAAPAAPRAETPEQERPEARDQFETTKDFGGIPDIDALMQLSDSDLEGLDSDQPAPRAQEPAPVPARKAAPEPVFEIAPEPAPEPAPELPEPAAPVELPVVEPSPEPEIILPAQAEVPPAQAQEQPQPAAEPEPSLDELAEFEKQLAAAPQGGAMENKPEEEKPRPEPAPEAAMPEPEFKAAADFEALTIEPETPAARPEEPAPQPAAEPAPQEPVLSIEPAPREPAAEPQPEAAQTLQLEPSVSVSPAAEPTPAAGIELSLGVQPGSAPQFGAPAEPQPAAAPEQGLVLEPASAAVSPSPEPSGEETLVVPPPAGASGDEEKTVIFEAGSAPGITSRSQAGDLAGLAGRAAPEGIPAERQRSLAFLFAPEDKGLCATVLAELDAICLKSGSKPMFIRRASVGECDANANANYIMQSVTDAGANGLVCVGGVPQEKLYEIESVFNSGGGFFRHYDSSSFSHSAALDLVMDLILR